MKVDTCNQILCPFCTGHLLLKEAFHGVNEVERGRLECVLCKRFFPISNYIPRFSTDDNYCASFGIQWNRYRKAQIDKLNKFHFSEERLFSVTDWPRNMKGEKILDVGSGAGRFTQILLTTGAEVFSFDSSNAVDSNFENNGPMHNLILFQADLHCMPLRYEQFDRILCLGVLQHTRDPKHAFMSIVPYLKSGGELVMDIYKRTIISMLRWKYFLRPITKRIDNEKLLSIVEKIVPALLPLAICLRKIGGPFGARLMPIANYSHMGISRELNREWSILDTYDMYSPAYDNPQTLSQVRTWFLEAGFTNIDVRYSFNGIVGKGTRM